MMTKRDAWRRWAWTVAAGVLAAAVTLAFAMLVATVVEERRDHERCTQLGLQQDVPIGEWDTWMNACIVYMKDTRR